MTDSPLNRTAPERLMLTDALNMAAEDVEIVNRANGWFESDRRFGEDIALLHSEVSEMLEAYRDHGLADATSDTIALTDDGDARPAKPEGVGSEAADVLIRLVDTCRRHSINLSWEFERKLEFNSTRGHRHGGKNL